MENKAFYMVYMEGQNTPSYKHLSIEAAENEAKRLCKLHKMKCYILCSIKSLEINEFQIEDCRPDTYELPF